MFAYSSSKTCKFLNYHTKRTIFHFFLSKKSYSFSFHAGIKYCAVYNRARSSMWPFLSDFSKDTEHKETRVHYCQSENFILTEYNKICENSVLSPTTNPICENFCTCAPPAPNDTRKIIQ